MASNFYDFSQTPLHEPAKQSPYGQSGPGTGPPVYWTATVQTAEEAN
jgi:hypothetical protein